MSFFNSLGMVVNLSFRSQLNSVEHPFLEILSSTDFYLPHWLLFYSKIAAFFFFFLLSIFKYWNISRPCLDLMLFISISLNIHVLVDLRSVSEY